MSKRSKNSTSLDQLLCENTSVKNDVAIRDAELSKKDIELAQKNVEINFLHEQLKLMRQSKFGKKSESSSNLQIEIPY